MELGYQAVSTRQVAKQCGISQPTLYYHFVDKQELYVAVLLEALKRLNRELEVIAGAENQTVEEKLGRMAFYMMQQTHHDINLRSMLHDIEVEIDETSRQKVSEAFFRSIILPIMSVIQPVCRPEDNLSPVKLAFIFLNIISSGGDREFRQMTGQPVQAEMLGQEATRLTQFFLHGLLHG
jgi:AcrR family transcriptional regulator